MSGRQNQGPNRGQSQGRGRGRGRGRGQHQQHQAQQYGNPGSFDTGFPQQQHQQQQAHQAQPAQQYGNPGSFATGLPQQQQQQQLMQQFGMQPFQPIANYASGFRSMTPQQVTAQQNQNTIDGILQGMRMAMTSSMTGLSSILEVHRGSSYQQPPPPPPPQSFQPPPPQNFQPPPSQQLVRQSQAAKPPQGKQQPPKDDDITHRLTQGAGVKKGKNKPRKKTPRGQTIVPRSEIVCDGCKNLGHGLGDCVVVDEYGYVVGCGPCNSTQHEYDNCPRTIGIFPSDNIHWLVHRRHNKPMIKTKIDITKLREFKASRDNGRPHTPGFAMGLKGRLPTDPARGLPERPYDYYNEYGQETEDPVTKEKKTKYGSHWREDDRSIHDPMWDAWERDPLSLPNIIHPRIRPSETPTEQQSAPPELSSVDQQRLAELHRDMRGEPSQSQGQVTASQTGLTEAMGDAQLVSDSVMRDEFSPIPEELMQAAPSGSGLSHSRTGAMNEVRPEDSVSVADAAREAQNEMSSVIIINGVRYAPIMPPPPRPSSEVRTSTVPVAARLTETNILRTRSVDHSAVRGDDAGSDASTALALPNSSGPRLLTANADNSSQISAFVAPRSTGQRFLDVQHRTRSEASTVLALPGSTGARAIVVDDDDNISQASTALPLPASSGARLLAAEDDTRSEASSALALPGSTGPRVLQGNDNRSQVGSNFDAQSFSGMAFNFGQSGEVKKLRHKYDKGPVR